ncbi:MAG TPA: DUF2332 family protein [Burkholderiaceae bacterium]|nr:DUF2332 family protein [Burkholderiaceae bacterium]
MSSSSRGIPGAFRRQIDYCARHGAPFTAAVLDAALAEWHDDAGTLRALLPDWPGHAWADALPLRVAGVLHAMVLDGSAPALAALYPPQRTAFDPTTGALALRAALAAQRERVADYLRVAPQTNEIGRSAALLGGFAAVAQHTGLPLATLEIGASAGLNGLWPHCRFELGALAWGDAASPVVVRSDWRGTPPALPPAITVASQAACDAAPLDLREPGVALRLASYVWPEHAERLARLRAAVALAQTRGVPVERADALDWCRRELAAARPGRATVLVHSVMWQYMAEATRAGLRECIDAAGARATREAPFAWLSFEPPGGDAPFELALTLWPGGTRRVLARAQAHGAWVEWP